MTNDRTVLLGRGAKRGGTSSSPSCIYLLLFCSIFSPGGKHSHLWWYKARAAGIAQGGGSVWSDLYICYFLVPQLNGAFHFIIVFFFYNFIRHVSLNLNYGNTGKEISPLKLQWKHLIEKAVNCHFCFAGWGNEEERETCCLWAGRAPAKAGPACRCSGARVCIGAAKRLLGADWNFSIKRPISGLSEELRGKRRALPHSCLLSTSWAAETSS